MFATLGRLLAGWFVLALLAPPAAAAETPAPSAAASPAKYTLRYKFRPGETIKWQVEQRVEVQTTVSGNTQTAELFTGSMKVWRIKEVAADGSVTLENLAEDVQMRQKLTGRAESRYNSKTDKKPPLGFETVAQSIGVPLSRITLDGRGKVVKRQHLAGANSDSQGQVTLPLPDRPVAVGENWSIPFDLEVPLQGKMIKRIKTLQSFTLESVAGEVATIRVATQILTPIDDPALETQIMQKDTSGVVRFDMAAGRVVGQQMEVDKNIVGFRGAASSCSYRMRFTEKILDAEKKTAEAAPPKESQAKAGPAKPAADAPKTLPPPARSAQSLTAVPPEPPAKDATRR
jgi:hypothetical protein